MKNTQLSFKKFSSSSLVLASLASMIISLTLALATTKRATNFQNSDSTAQISDYNQQIALNPSDAIAYRNRGNAYYRLGNSQKAISDYDRAIALNPQDADAYYNSGLVYIILGKKKKLRADS